jgi:hypothetical protein
MNRKNFIEAYTSFIKSVKKLNKIAVRHGLSAMEDELEDLDFEDFKMGLRLLIDKVDPGIIDEIFTNLIKFTKDSLDRQLKVIIKRAIFGIQKKERTSILFMVLNSYANLSSKEKRQIDFLLEYESESVTETEADDELSTRNFNEFSKLILKLDNKALYNLLREVDTEDLSMSLKNQNKAVRENVYNSLSKRAAFMLDEDIDHINPESEDIKRAQEKVINLIQMRNKE